MTRKNNEKRSFVFYDSFLEAMKHLNDAEFRECVMRIRDFALEGDDTESEHPMVNIILALAKPNLEAARRRYVASIENGKKGAEFGKLGGAPKGNQNARKKQPLKQPLDVDDNVDVEEDVNVNENEEVDVNEDTPVGNIVPSSFSVFSSSTNPSNHQEPSREAPLQYNIQVKDEEAEYRMCRCLYRLATDKKNNLPLDEKLFKLAVESNSAAYGVTLSDAQSNIPKLIDGYIKTGMV